MVSESSPLLQFPGLNGGQSQGLGDHHSQFCNLVGVRPVNLPPSQKHNPHPESLYYRAVRHRNGQSTTYLFTSTLVNGLLLAQVVLGAALTGLGASDSSRVLITVFGALNTVIAGLIAFLKSRGQPMRARMFRDDLERVVDEIENSAVMWLGISKGVHGYDAIDTDEAVTVRSEVARLTRLYDRAVKTNTMNDPDMYAAGGVSDAHGAPLRTKPGQAPGPAPAPAPSSAPMAASGDAVPPAPVPAINAPAVDPDDSPASKAPEPAKDKDKDKTPTPPEQPGPSGSSATTNKDEAASETKSPEPKVAPPAAAPAPTPTPTPAAADVDEDASPASAATPPKAHAKDSKDESDSKEANGAKEAAEVKDSTDSKTATSSNGKDSVLDSSREDEATKDTTEKGKENVPPS